MPILLDKPTARKSSYDPGTVKSITPLGDDRFQVESFREAGKSYMVTQSPFGDSCTCPDCSKRNRECKHILAAREFEMNRIREDEDWCALLRKAERFTDDQILRGLANPNLSRLRREALEFERSGRKIDREIGQEAA